MFATLRENRGKTAQIQWFEGMDGHALLSTLGIAAEEVAIFLINGMHSKVDTQLNMDDVVSLFPPVGGG